MGAKSLAKRIPYLAVCMLTAVGCISGSGEGSAQPELQPIRIGIAIPSYVHAVAWIADEKSYYEQEGLDANVQVMGGSSATAQALIAGKLDVGIAGGDAVVKADMAGADLVVVAGLVDSFYHRLIAVPEVERLEDATDKRIGLPFFGGPQETAVKYALASVDLSYDDVSILALGAEFNRIVALSRGDIDITTSDLPISRLRELGFHVVADLPSWDVHFPYAVVIIQKSYLEENESQIRAFIRAFCRGIVFYKDESNKAESLRIIQRHLGAPSAGEAAGESYDYAGPKLIAYPPYPTEAAFQTVLDFSENPQARALQPNNFFDLRIFEELQGEGDCTDGRLRKLEEKP